MEKNSFLLKVDKEEDIKYLERYGYENVQNVSFDRLRAKVLVIDEMGKTFLPISVTCLAAMNIKPLNFQEFKVINELNNSQNDDLGIDL